MYPYGQIYYTNQKFDDIEFLGYCFLLVFDSNYSVTFRDLTCWVLLACARQFLLWTYVTCLLWLWILCVGLFLDF